MTLLIVALLLASSLALAQITTGTISGNVRDEQGGVIQGATVVLISEARGTRTAPAVTNETGNYVFPNVTPDTYTVEVTMDSFKTGRRTGNARNAVDPRTGQILTAPGAANTAAAIGTVVPNSGNLVNGVRQASDGIAKTSYVWPRLVVAPRFGMRTTSAEPSRSSCAPAAGCSTIALTATPYSRFREIRRSPLRRIFATANSRRWGPGSARPAFRR